MRIYTTSSHVFFQKTLQTVVLFWQVPPLQVLVMVGADAESSDPGAKGNEPKRTKTGAKSDEPKRTKKRPIKNSWTPEVKISFVQKNTRAPKSKAFARFEKYKHASTVKEALELGATFLDLDTDKQRKLVRLVDVPSQDEADDLEEDLQEAQESESFAHRMDLAERLKLERQVEKLQEEVEFWKAKTRLRCKNCGF